MPPQPKPSSRETLLDVAIAAFRRRGYANTSVADLCDAAGVTKGAFFHHFKNKDDLARQAADRFGVGATALFDAGEHNKLDDPRDRLLGYVDLRIRMIDGPIPDFCCYFGTLVQEVHETHPDIRDKAASHIVGHVDVLAAEVEKAKAAYAPDADWQPRDVAMFMQTTVQGMLIMAKATQDPAVAVASLRQLRLHLEHLLPPRRPARPSTSKGKSDVSSRTTSRSATRSRR
jgi:TetR/AcrR family transcriptional repressor of nem operon